MNYTKTSIANVALGRIGARGQITNVDTENSPNAVKVKECWDFVFQEVLAERDWKFAKTRVQLQLSPVTPLYTWKFAWALPADFVRFVRPRRKQVDRNWYWGYGPEGTGWYNNQDPPFWPARAEYKVETLTAGWLIVPGQNPAPYPPPFPTGQYCLTNYGGGCVSGSNAPGAIPAAITYIRLITDYTQLTPGFVNCLANRLAMELAVSITEDKAKREDLKQDYKDSLNSAEAQNESSDTVLDEDGSESWVRAGRRADVWWS